MENKLSIRLKILLFGLSNCKSIIIIKKKSLFPIFELLYSNYFGKICFVKNCFMINKLLSLCQISGFLFYGGFLLQYSTHIISNCWEWWELKSKSFIGSGERYDRRQA